MGAAKLAMDCEIAGRVGQGYFEGGDRFRITIGEKMLAPLRDWRCGGGLRCNLFCLTAA
jgi:hypothetical protein